MIITTRNRLFIWVIIRSKFIEIVNIVKFKCKQSKKDIEIQPIPNTFDTIKEAIHTFIREIFKF
jgi:hypothetical protein